jgi:hypothetical protein
LPTPENFGGFVSTGGPAPSREAKKPQEIWRFPERDGTLLWVLFVFHEFFTRDVAAFDFLSTFSGFSPIV